MTDTPLTMRQHAHYNCDCEVPLKIGDRVSYWYDGKRITGKLLSTEMHYRAYGFTAGNILCARVLKDDGGKGFPIASHLFVPDAEYHCQEAKNRDSGFRLSIA